MNHGKKKYSFGLHTVESLLANQPDRVIQIIVQKDRHDKKIQNIIDLAKTFGIPFEYQSKQTLDKLSQNANHQGVLAYSARTSGLSEDNLFELLQQLKTPPLLLLLDEVQDPHNLGACFRSAEAFGVNAIIAPKDRAVGITPIVSKVASGTAEIVPFVQVTNLVRTMDALKEMGIWMYGAAAEAERSMLQANFKTPTGIVLGAEGTGLRRLTREHCDELVNIPMHGTVASLNVSVAAGIFLYEVSRQRSGL